MILNYFLYDVFTKEKFGGGPLSVVEIPKELEAEISDTQLQIIAREFNLAETVFIFESDKKDIEAKLRIFSVDKELPLAGHPTIGASTHIKATHNNVGNEFMLELNAGPTKIEFEDGRAYMSQQPHTSRGVENLDLDLLCDSIGRDKSAINFELPIEFSSTGLEFLIIPIKDVDELSKVTTNANSAYKLLTAYDCDAMYLFTPLDVQNNYCVRMFWISGGNLLEDTSTGSAAGSFTMYLHKNKSEDNPVGIQLEISQGTFLNRPSVIYTSIIERDDGQIVPRVGGDAIKLAEGKLFA